jgi:hypothetical protein
MPMTPLDENDAYAGLLCGHLQAMVYRLRLLKPEHWDFQFAPAAPSARTLAVHAWQWLLCDRQHITEPDASRHPRVPEPPDDPQALCDALAAETENWRGLIRSLTPEQLASARKQFNEDGAAMNVRGFVCHMIQNCIYKHGQFSTIFFALGYDGTEPYTAPFPNPIYDEIFGPETD